MSHIKYYARSQRARAFRELTWRIQKIFERYERYRSDVTAAQPTGHYSYVLQKSASGHVRAPICIWTSKLTYLQVM